MLSEEIIKSLSPAQPPGFTDATPASTAAYQAAAADPTRESSYLGDVYGDYWATPEDKAEPGLLLVGKTTDADKEVQSLPPLPTVAPKEEGNPADRVRSSSPSSPTHAAPVQASDPEPKGGAGSKGRQRQFSWEAPPQPSPPGATSAPAADFLVEQKSLGSGADNVGPSATEATAKSSPEPSEPSSAREEEKSAEDLRAEFAPEFNPAATLGATLGLDRPIQSPSPVSDLTDKQGEAKRMSLAEEKIFFEGSSQPVSPSPPLEQHPAFADDQQPRAAELPEATLPKSILGFRNIMELPSPAERIRQYNESRWQFSAIETGLDEWLQSMTSQHPEHANEVASYSMAAAHAQQGGQAGAQTLGQGGRGPTLHIPNLQHGLSGLGHSSNQVGTKSKELLMAAGKAGKGLFSKGRNKLRGTGDKVFSST